RVATTERAANMFFDYHVDVCADGQIAREISYFRSYYQKLVPSCLIIYDRVAYFEPNGDLRLTIDFNPRYRVTQLNLSTDMNGISLLPEGYGILEIKVQQAMPLWLTEILSQGKIYKGTFSKYGEAYKQQLLKIKNV
ncbi:MAG: VTC domain-containing protein, partial [Clostridia bacterium]|nr:VTC domain-containing protein [Clostridia bacterium]